MSYLELVCSPGPRLPCVQLVWVLSSLWSSPAVQQSLSLHTQPALPWPHLAGPLVKSPRHAYFWLVPRILDWRGQVQIPLDFRYREENALFRPRSQPLLSLHRVSLISAFCKGLADGLSAEACVPSLGLVTSFML